MTDPEVRRRLAFLKSIEEDPGVIRVWESVCRAAADPMIDAFYAHLLQTRETSEILKKHSTVDRQRPMVTRYLMGMFTDALDDPYIGYRRVGGEVHERIDLDSHWFVAMDAVIREHVQEPFASAPRGGVAARRVHALP